MSSTIERKGKHVTTACDQCRRMKVKCDAVSPRCANCERVKSECTYRRGPDRRKVSKVAVTQLIDRIRLLEETLKQNNIPLPGGFSQGDKTYTSLVGQGSPLPTGLTETGGLLDFAQGLDWTSDLRFEAEEPVDSGLNREKALIEAIGGPKATSNTSAETDIERLSKRLGSLRVAEDGELRFYGATSNMHILQGPSQGTKLRTAKGDEQAILNRADVGQYVPRELEDHLIKLYFAWENPFVYVVDKDVFMESRKQAFACSVGERYESFYSELLTNAMCTVGAAFSDRVVLELPEPMAEFFATRSKALLDVDMDSPSIATVQALVLLSAHEAAFTRDSRGWLYSGMAMRLAVDLGLHLDTELYVRAGKLSLREATVRKVTFWGTYFLDRGWSYYVGRPAMLIDDNGVTVKHPTDDHDRKDIWEPYVEDPGPENGYQAPHSYLDAQCTAVKQQVLLYIIMGKLQRVFYDQQTGSISQLQFRTQEITAELEQWKDQLPDEISSGATSDPRGLLPHCLMLNMQYNEVMMFANHPFISSPGGQQVAYSPDTRRLCLEAASNVARLLRLYQQNWSIRRANVHLVHVCLTTALVHLYFACTAELEDVYQNAMTDLETVCEALGTLSRAWRSAYRALDSLASIRQIWQGWLQSPISTTLSQNVFDARNSLLEFGRWESIEAVIQAAMETAGSLELTPKEDVSWLESWMNMQALTGDDPFAMGFA